MMMSAKFAFFCFSAELSPAASWSDSDSQSPKLSGLDCKVGMEALEATEVSSQSDGNSSVVFSHAILDFALLSSSASVRGGCVA